MSVYQNIISQYCQGDGVFAGEDISRNHRWAYNEKPNNFYRIISVVPPETADYVLVDKGLFGSTKYDPILLKEWFYTTKLKGNIIVPVSDEQVAANLESLISGFYPKQALNIIRQEFDNKGKIFIIQKTKAALAENDNIDSWTFGIITNGKRNKAMEEIIQSIHQQQIPNYEIIVCGTYFNRREGNFRYINFTEHDERGWLTKKKNLIAEVAKHENLVIIHDRMVFQPGWHEGMKRWGNYFDALSCITLFKFLNAQLRAFDWLAHDPETIKVPPVRNPLLRAAGSRGVARSEMALHYDDWDRRVVMCGSMTIVKHSLWKLAPWDERLFWVNYDDVNISQRITDDGGTIRFNPYSRCETLYWGHCLISVAKRDSNKLSQEFEPNPIAHDFYNFKYYTKLRWKHFRQDVKKILETKRLYWLINIIQSFRKKRVKQ